MINIFVHYFRYFWFVCPVLSNNTQPVDEMIESGLLALPRIYAQNMRELYAILKSEADLVMRFRNWWDYVCQELRTIDEILLEQDADGR